MVYERFSLCSLGYGWLGHAVLQLELERWYVGMAVLEGGGGGLPGIVEQLDVGAVAPKALSVECVETFCRVGDEVISMMIVGVVWRTGGLGSSSTLERPVFTRPVAFTASSLWLW
jgi:hypothetical protein